MIDLSINLSHIITLVSMVGGGIYFVSRMELKLGIIVENHKKFLENVEKIEKDIKSIETKVENHGLALMKLSNQEDRLVSMDNRMNELSRRLEAFIIPSKRRRN